MFHFSYNLSPSVLALSASFSFWILIIFCTVGIIEKSVNGIILAASKVDPIIELRKYSVGAQYAASPNPRVAVPPKAIMVRAAR